MHISTASGQHSSTSAELVLERLTDLRARRTTTLHYAVETAAIDRPGQLVVAIVGRMTAEDADSLLRVRRNRAQGLAIVLDVDSFAETPGGSRVGAQHELAVKILRDNQWRVIEVAKGTTVAETWAGLEQLGTAA